MKENPDRKKMLPLRKHNHTGVGHTCEGQNDGVCTFSKNGEGGNEFEVVIGEST